MTNTNNNLAKIAKHFFAFFYRSAECLKFLVTRGANVHLVDNFTRTALHYAASQFWFQCLFTLVGAGTFLSDHSGVGS